MHVKYEMIPCIGFRREVQSVDSDAGQNLPAKGDLLGERLKINVYT